MRILGLVGSPRRESNTDLVVNSILDGAASNGHIIDKLYLYGLDLKPLCRLPSLQTRQFPMHSQRRYAKALPYAPKRRCTRLWHALVLVWTYLANEATH
jgi:NAD(P)H-dependent FMN reductase